MEILDDPFGEECGKDYNSKESNLLKLELFRVAPTPMPRVTMNPSDYVYDPHMTIHTYIDHMSLLSDRVPTKDQTDKFKELSDLMTKIIKENLKTKI